MASEAIATLNTVAAVYLAARPLSSVDAGMVAEEEAWGLPLSLDAQAGIVNIYHPGAGGGASKLPMGE